VRLTALGVRAISNVVDATNLVMMETGQPLHAFDFDRVAGHRVVVRDGLPGALLKTLDGVDRALAADDVAICDGDERPIALAGVMGGAATEVGPATTRVLLECAYFDPARVRRTAKRLGLHSEASHRFERGTDPNGLPYAAWRCAAAILAGSPGARVAGPLVDHYPHPVAPRRLELRGARTRRLLGAQVGTDEQASLLSALGLTVEARGDTLSVRVPTHRPDLTREVDLVEEVARLVGYDRVAPRLPPLGQAPPRAEASAAEVARTALVGLGLEETISYSFVGPAQLAAFGAAAPLRLANPIREEQSAMRTTLCLGLAQALQRNLARGVADARLFEVGTVFSAREGAALPDEHTHVAAILTGRRDGWLAPAETVDAFDAKGVVEELAEALGHRLEVRPARLAWLHPGAQGALARVGDEAGPAGAPARAIVGCVGELHPEVRAALGLEVPAFVFELDLTALGAAARPTFRPLPRFPQVLRDLSFFVDAELPARDIRTAIDRVKDPLCIEVRVLEDYRDQGRVPAGKKGMLWSFVYRAEDRTLTDAEVKAAHEPFVARLKSALALEQR
jgi:phenylalanyl-tRNA synthetase beta chain